MRRPSRERCERWLHLPENTGFTSINVTRLAERCGRPRGRALNLLPILPSTKRPLRSFEGKLAIGAIRFSTWSSPPCGQVSWAPASRGAAAPIAAIDPLMQSWDGNGRRAALRKYRIGWLAGNGLQALVAWNLLLAAVDPGFGRAP